MGEISRRLQEQIRAAAPTASRRFTLIVDLEPNADWSEGLRLLKDAGLEISSHEPAIGAVFGQAPADAIPRIAAVPGVQLVEPDEQATKLS